MPKWQPAAAVFRGGTEQIKALKGRRVRARTRLVGILQHEPTRPGQHNMDIAHGALGFVANPHPSQPALLLAFSTQPGANHSSIEALQRSNAFQVAVLNEPTFRLQFDVEVP